MNDDLDAQRTELGILLAAGLDTDWQHRAYSHDEIRRVVDALQALAPGDVQGRLRIGGFTLTPFVAEDEPEIEQSCRTCMYYEAHSRFCALPELMLPVEPEWSCVLWRI